MFNKLTSTDVNKFISVHYSVLLLRIGAGLFIFTHGLPKLMKVINGDFGFADPIGIGPELSLILAAFAEGICGLFVTLGLWTRIASFILVINMAVAVFFAHAGDPFSQKEKALIFLLMFMVTLFTGGGKYSIDSKL
ncbi:DoxX family protein [Gracilimonas mengyeensis]|uniref:Putative oxidoreductase n=1 Tax=Gracilimonas mengyeensis TaxID=1302730 RepID=A0A521BRT5_9BACT|nr:DoxX family protein [Gracilimonas mengyeensis]SMO49877.1 putative oxidoreductase [Gracilimonas mengyeensis]